MAIIFRGTTRCALCDGVLREQDDVVATSAFLPCEHALWRFSDAAMHQACFLSWPRRAEFVSAFNAAVAGRARAPRMLEDGTLVTSRHPAREAAERDVLRRLDEERERRAADRLRAEQRWAGRPRSCPKCAREFTSVQDRGVCPACGHVSHASEHGGG